MTYRTTLRRNTLLAAASALALPLETGGTAIAQTSHALPAVQVDAPAPRAARRAVPRRTAVAAPRATPRPGERRTPTTPPTGMIGSLPAPYAGGQVASGAQVGLLGNRSVMDTPFNQTSYTAKTIQDQQARKLDDVLANDPSVRVNVPRASGFDSVYIRGFNVSSSGYGLNGLYGVAAGYSFSSLSAIERVEVLKGPGALLNGMPPAGGGVGGTVNLVTKRAGEEPLAQMTNTYSSRASFGTNLDVSQRFGEDKEFGLRFNGTYRNGATELANQSQELGSAFVGMDYRGERVRLSADYGYERNSIDVMTRFVDLGTALTGIPRAPDGRQDFMPTWGFWRGEGRYALVQGEVDLAENLTAYAQAGRVEGTTRYLYSDIRMTNLNGEFSGVARRNNQEREQMAAQAGFRAAVDTGPVSHSVNFNATGSEAFTKIINTTGTPFTSNLYNPRPSPVPTVDVGDPLKVSDSQLTSFGVADTRSVWNNRIQLTVGARQQNVDTGSFNTTTGARTGYVSTALTPAYALVVKPLENVSVYANYIEGLEAGTIVGAGFANTGEVLPPYQTRQYETGVKIDWGSVITTVSAFDILKPIQLVDRVTNTVTQSGETRNRGVEINAFGQVTENFRLLGGVMYIDARQQKTDLGTYDGFRTFNIPGTQLNLGGEWDVPFLRGLPLTARAIHTGEAFADQANKLTVPSWTRYDAGARYTFASPWNGKPAVVRFSVENLLDTNYWQAATNERYLILAAPRTYLLSTTFNF
jgi:iron complex outermembrane receptor protein